MPLYRLAAVNDILAAIARIERYLDGSTEDAFQSDTLRQDAVIRCLEVISEASRRIPVLSQNACFNSGRCVAWAYVVWVVHPHALWCFVWQRPLQAFTGDEQADPGRFSDIVSPWQTHS